MNQKKIKNMLKHLFLIINKKKREKPILKINSAFPFIFIISLDISLNRHTICMLYYVSTFIVTCNIMSNAMISQPFFDLT